MKTIQSLNQSAVTPRPDMDESVDKQFKIAYWFGVYEAYLFNNARESTYERYSRALSKFYAHFPEKRFTYDFLRCDIESYKERRLAEGARATTVGMELSILRGFWRFMLRSGAAGVMFNPVNGVRVKSTKPVLRRPVFAM